MIKIAWSPVYAHPLPEGHRFPMSKYELIPAQLLHEGVIAPMNLFEPTKVNELHILLAHDADYWRRMKNLELTEKEMRTIGFPLSHGLIEREQVLVQGTIDCALAALEYGCSLNIAGGTHHAFASHGEGFCLLNDQAIAAHYLLYHNHVKRILILDLDVHQGNGTASIFKQNNQVFTLSIHGQENYPLRKEVSDMDIALPSGTEGPQYLDKLNQTLKNFVTGYEPDFIFFNAGVDVLATDRYGKLKLTPMECRERDNQVFSFCHKHKIPVVTCMGGGYSAHIKDIVNAHCETFKAAFYFFT